MEHLSAIQVGRRKISHKYPFKTFRSSIVRLAVGRDKSLQNTDNQLIVCSHIPTS